MQLNLYHGKNPKTGEKEPAEKNIESKESLLKKQEKGEAISIPAYDNEKQKEENAQQQDTDR